MRRQGGFTLIELLVSLTIGLMLLSLLAAATPILLRLSPRLSEKLTVEHALSGAAQWLSRDARRAQSFEPLEPPAYGAFEWEDYSAGERYRAIYYYQPETKSLWRRLEADGEEKSTSEVARGILRAEDVEFEWSSDARVVKIELTSSGARGYSQTTRLLFRLRAQGP